MEVFSRKFVHSVNYTYYRLGAEKFKALIFSEFPQLQEQIPKVIELRADNEVVFLIAKLLTFCTQKEISRLLIKSTFRKPTFSIADFKEIVDTVCDVVETNPLKVLVPYGPRDENKKSAVMIICHLLINDYYLDLDTVIELTNKMRTQVLMFLNDFNRLKETIPSEQKILLKYRKIKEKLLKEK